MFTRKLFKTKARNALVLSLLLLGGGHASWAATINVEFNNTYLITTGDILNFTPSYVDNTTCAYIADILKPVAGNTKQYEFLGTTGYYCLKWFDANPFVYGAKRNWYGSYGASPGGYNYSSNGWLDGEVNNTQVYNSHLFLKPNDPKTYKSDPGDNGPGYIYVMPVDDSKKGAPSVGSKDVDFTQDLSYFSKSKSSTTYFGYGHIWIVGHWSFGFPSVWAWKGDHCFVGWGTGLSRDNFTPLTQTSKNYHQITMKTGKQLDTKQAFEFKFYHDAMAWDGNGSKGEFNTSGDYRFSGLVPMSSYGQTIDFLQIKSGGNIAGAAASGIEQVQADTKLPKLPLNYDIRFVIDLTGTVNWTAVPLQVAILNRPVLKENSNRASHVGVYLSGQLIPTDNTDWSDDGVNNYTLADALRFQAGILYANQGSTSYDEFKVAGTLTAEDLTYLTWLVQNKKIKQLDLSDARFPELTIPANFAKGSVLEKIVLPSVLNEIGESAFEGCANLATVDFTGTETGGCQIGASAFKDCTALSGASVEKILETTTEVKAGVFDGCLKTADNYEISIPANISSIAADAFKNCKITKVNVPAKYVAPTATAASVDRSGTPFSGTAVAISSGTVKIEAEDFNKGVSGVAYLFNNNSNLSAYYQYRDDMDGEPVWSVSRPASHNDKCQVPSDATGNHLIIGDIEKGDWMNYTVNGGDKGGKYTITFYVAKTGGNGAFSVYVDGKKVKSFTTIGGTNDNCEEANIATDVLIPNGNHVVQFYVDSKLNFDYMTFARTSEDTSKDTAAGESSTGYTGKVPEVAANAFTTDANHLEIGFAAVGEGGYASEAEQLDYVHEYKKNAQWLALLTKDLYENNSSLAVDNAAYLAKKYDVCDQQFADVRLHRVFTPAANPWETLVLPFDVKAGTKGTASSYSNSGTVNTTQNMIAYAAIFVGVNNTTLRFLNVGSQNTTGGETYGSTAYTIEAGTPFVVRMQAGSGQGVDAVNGNYVTFADVNLKSNATLNHQLIDGYWFCGTFDAIPQSAVPSDHLWALSGGKIVEATATAKFKGYRGWFQTNTDPAGDASKVFPYVVGTPAKSSIRSLGFSAEDGNGLATGINSLVESGKVEFVDGIYTLTGVRVMNPAQKGIYIVNGKKMVVK